MAKFGTFYENQFLPGQCHDNPYLDNTTPWNIFPFIRFQHMIHYSEIFSLVSFCCSAVINFESLWETSPHLNKEYLLIVQASLVTSKFSSPSNAVLLSFFIPFLFSLFFPFLRFLSSLFCRSYLIISSLTFFLSFLVFSSLAATLHPAWWYFSVFKWEALLITSCCNIYSRH